ncbi:MAG: redox-sensing transcriptional repressor Rex [Christensenella sp.]
MNTETGSTDKHLIRKLTRYYRYLNEQKLLGKTVISSNKLAKLMNVSPSQIRQDFNRLMYEGYHGVGYNIDTILLNISRLLNFKQNKNLIIIGAGNLGQSLCNYASLADCGFTIKAFFDINPRLENAVINSVPVYPMNKIESYIKDEDITVAILSLPTAATKGVAHKLYSYGIRLFLNFNPVFFDFNDDVYIENVHMDDNIMMLSYKSGLLQQKDDFANK